MNENLPFKRIPKDLVAVEIRVGDETKHVGKIGVAPLRSHPMIQGRRILYKEVNSFDLYCRVTRTYSIDRMALDWVVLKRGVEFLVIFCWDAPALLMTPAALVQESNISDLGERPQYRFKPKICELINGDYRIDMGWTNRVVVVDDLFGKHRQVPQLGIQKAESLFG